MTTAATAQTSPTLVHGQSVDMQAVPTRVEQDDSSDLANWNPNGLGFGSDDGFEELSDYIHGGSCVIYLGQNLNDDVYTVVYKVRSGYASNMWLARDNCFTSSSNKLHPLKYVTLWILSSKPSPAFPLIADQEQFHHPGVAEVLTSFSYSSINGIHKILVMPVLRPLQQLPQIIKEPSDIKTVFTQLLRGVAYLHSRNVVHGNINTENTAFVCAPLTDLMLEGLPEPWICPVPQWAYKKAQGRLPEYIVSDIWWTSRETIVEHAGTPLHVCILDLSWASRVPLVDILPDIPCAYMPPEYVFDQKVASECTLPASDLREHRLQDYKVDIWALGCTFLEFLTGTPPLSLDYYGGSPEPESILHLDHEFPHDWWLPSPLHETNQYDLRQATTDFWTDTLADVHAMFRFRPKAEDSQARVPLDGFILLLRYMLVLDPRSRPSAEEVLRFLDQQAG